MMISTHIWEELGPLAACVEKVDHETGEVAFTGTVSETERGAVMAIVAAHDPNAATVASFVAAMDRRYDSVARAKNYDNRYTCALRAGYQGPFQSEGQLFAVWMDNCNEHGYTVLDDVKAGRRPMPTEEEFLAELPAAPW